MLSALPMRSASVAIRLVSLPVCAALDGPARSTWIRTVAAGPGEIGSEGGHGEEGIGVVSIAMVSIAAVSIAAVSMAAASIAVVSVPTRGRRP